MKDELLYNMKVKLLNDDENPTNRVFFFFFFLKKKFMVFLILWKNSNPIELLETKTKVHK